MFLEALPCQAERDLLTMATPNGLARSLAAAKYLSGRLHLKNSVRYSSSRATAPLLREGTFAGTLTIRSSRDRFAARLHGDVYHSAVPRSGPA